MLPQPWKKIYLWILPSSSMQYDAFVIVQTIMEGLRWHNSPAKVGGQSAHAGITA